MLSNFFSHPDTIKIWHELRSSPNLTVKHCDLPYSFAVFDGTRCLIEVMNPAESETFFIGLVFENKPLCDNLVQNFQKLWVNAVEDPMQKLLKKPLDEVLGKIARHLHYGFGRTDFQ